MNERKKLCLLAGVALFVSAVAVPLKKWEDTHYIPGFSPPRPQEKVHPNNGNTKLIQLSNSYTLLTK